MRLRRTPHAAEPRRGVILLIVLVMLTLFAIAGLTFVLYADAASESARFNREAETFVSSGGPDMDPTTSFNMFLGQFIYGVSDPVSPTPTQKGDMSGAYTALRGHSLAETMYGSWDALPSVPSDVPWSGTGRLKEPNLGPNNTDGFSMVNLTYYVNDGFLRDPARPGKRTDPSQPRGTYTGGQNAPYTYPDLNSMFLASIQPSTGKVVTPSYVRPWNFTNNDWTSPEGKYKMLRPRPADMGQGFPMPDPATNCDVQNLVGIPGNTSKDSIWIDIGAPELYTASGLRYKMLVAPLILDLDNRVNLNVVSNVFGANNAHAGNQGWGQWEVNMSRVLNGDSAASPTEWQNLFIGSGTTTGRYGADKLPSSAFGLNGVSPHIYAPADLNGVNEGSYTPTSPPLSLPPAPPAMSPQSSYFAYFPSQGYGNGGSTETQKSGTNAHPFFYNPMTKPTVGDDRLFPVASYATLLWAGISASPNSDLAKLCPKNYVPHDTTLGTTRRMHETTLLSMDLDRPGAVPYISNPTSAAYTVAYSVSVSAPGSGSYTSNGTPTVGIATPPTFPTVSPKQGGVQGEFDPTTWRSTLAATLLRIDLNRTLTPYTGNGANPAQAAKDRQNFANDIFTRLVAVTGMQSFQSGPNPTQYATLRWLAQLSANIVDYIDNDDVMTAFHWTQSPQAPDTGYVFGTELPKLVVNEVYLEYDNDQADPATIPNPNPPPLTIQVAKKDYHMNVWAELLNPLPSAADPNGAGANDAKLMVGGQAAYQLVITSPNKGLRLPDNLAGDPDGAQPGQAPYATQQGPTGSYTTTNGVYSSTTTAGQVMAVVNTWGTVQSVSPVGSAQSGPAGPNPNPAPTGFLVIGPNDPQTFQMQPATSQVQMQASLTVVANDQTGKGMTYTIKNSDTNADTPTPPTVLLQRLANPNAAWNAQSNPFITVDYVDMQQVQTALPGKTVVNDARGYNSKGVNMNWTANNNAVQTVTNRYSFGRNQPYAAAALGTQWQQQTAGAPANPPFANPPTTTFFDVNTPGNPATPDWLVHLDRPLISPIELLHVSGFKPHELTQQFYKDASGNFQHVAPWVNYTTNGMTSDAHTFQLYRLLEFVRTGNATPGILANGRVPGKVNINTIDPNSPEIFQALCDPEPGNNINAGDVQQVFGQLMGQRTPGGTPGQNDKPFWGMAMGTYGGSDPQFPADGLQNTLLTPATPGQPQLMGVPTSQATAHPYVQDELLRKLFNNVTTRSNVFAVWLTVGFFQITNDTVQPMQLGAEVNLAQGKNIRHHMFAIVDRTQIQTFSTKTTGQITPSNPNSPQSINVSTTVQDMRMTPPRSWQIQQGSVLVYDPGVFNQNPNGAGPDPNQPNEETVIVGAGNQATFTYPHAQGATVISRGHPGPWVPSYDASKDGNVVPYFVIID